MAQSFATFVLAVLVESAVPEHIALVSNFPFAAYVLVIIPPLPSQVNVETLLHDVSGVTIHLH